MGSKSPLCPMLLVALTPSPCPCLLVQHSGDTTALQVSEISGGPGEEEGAAVPEEECERVNVCAMCGGVRV